ncbi:acyltransferase [Dactylosporangium fulvum]|uniref:Acyltransferase n=1 Tax=Dactylosporangium fulvum TaxID=53359 RepID=A0ABY5VLM0_9ACTN|nr:acyltransferase [Dactylosporangium fulvum]UWP78453.1 acyltransferase [Dactylosporangium fulvum]
MLIDRIEAATPKDRDRGVDALRAFAILGVVLGHWLVTALVVDGGAVHGTSSPLRHLPWLAPATWLLQTLAVFFFVGGLVAGRSYRGSDGPWVRFRLARLFRPVAVLLLVWAVACAVLLAAGLDTGTVRTLVKLVLSPLWFLLVFAALTAATPLAMRLHPGWPLLAVALVDAGRFVLDLPGWTGWLNLAAGWLVPYCLGARRPVASPWLLLIGGATATAVLVRWGGYPASMVGVPGEGVSNLNPPTLAAVTFGVAQVGLALLLLDPLRRLLRRPAVWAAVALVNLSAMTVFLWHQTAMLTTTGAALLVAGHPLPGLHTAPVTAGWLLPRLAWLPVFAAALLLCWALFHRFERPAGPRQPAGPVRPVVALSPAPPPPGRPGSAGTAV